MDEMAGGLMKGCVRRRTRHRRTRLTALTALVLLGAVIPAQHQDGASARISNPAREYLARALHLMETRSLLREETDWRQLRADAYKNAAGARTTTDTHAAIGTALRTLGDRHSFFWNPEEAAAATGTTTTRFHRPSSHPLAANVGYLSLPAVGGSDRTAAEYVSRGHEAIRETRRKGAVCGWVIDLRENTGGNMWPMLAVVAPILGDGDVGSFVEADGTNTTWSVRDAVPYLDGRALSWGDGPPPEPSGPPVALLTDGRTASAGEAVLVAFKGRPDTRTFGESTSGVPTANETHRLSDGAVLGITAARTADRTGRTYDAPIPPDQEVPTSRTGRSPHRDDALRAAEQWTAAKCAA